MVISCSTDLKSRSNNAKKLETDWTSMWISIFLQFIVGVQISVYYMSMWPYLSGLDKSADVDFLGWIVAACSIGCTITSPLYGYWNQRTMSVKWPSIAGFVIAGIGQLWYGLLSFSSSNTKWCMMMARFLTGLGVGNISVLRVYGATASTAEDRMKAISLGTGGFVFGIAFGPVISALSTPLGEGGISIGAFQLNMYTIVAYLMCLICVGACLVVWLYFEESYVGIIDPEMADLKIPRFDGIAAVICIYLFMMINMIATNIEVMSTPLTTVLYNWKDSESIFYNGITVFVSCVITVLINIVLATSRLGKTDKRHQMLVGVIFFLLYQLCMFPWSFYSGPLEFIPPGLDTTIAGGCSREFEWCNSTTRVPLPVYIFCFIVFFGLGFPFIEAPSAALYSEVLGPRKQGIMQGLFSLGGSLAPVIASISSTAIFQYSGYRYVILLQTVILLLGAILILLFYKRLVPLKMERGVESEN